MEYEKLIEKHAFVIECAIKYYVKNEPTGISDEDYDKLEKLANEDGLDIREIALSKLRGTRVKNADYVTPIPKNQVNGDMVDAIIALDKEYGRKLLWTFKMDGSSLMVYYKDGNPIRAVTAGGSNRSNEGIDQSDKLLKYFPKLDPRIKAIQCECLVKLEHGVDRPRQKANGLINSKDLDDEVDKYLNIRCFRYFSDFNLDYMSTLKSMRGVTNREGDFKFAPSIPFTTKQLLERYSRETLNGDEFEMTKGYTFNFDGLVAYGYNGEVIKALKSKDGGQQEFTTIESMEWNELSGKGKDGWSLNVRVNPPVEIKGSMVRRPSSGGVQRALRDSISPGAKVSLILAGSTIPKVDKIYEPGNGEMSWPVCICGYQTSEADTYGSNIKCGNPDCINRENRMKTYINEGKFMISDPRTYNGLFVLDRFKFEEKISPENLEKFINDLVSIFREDRGAGHLFSIIESLGITGLQRRNLQLVVRPAYKVLKDFINQDSHILKIS